MKRTLAFALTLVLTLGVAACQPEEGEDEELDEGAFAPAVTQQI